ncbi:LCP family protein [Streptomyces sp. NPDC047108]|uniref:LCP family protein n=1 Tax=Streptomyces sp. NPDC047108 TaxID=3155025 RepID=UPI0033DA7987
MRQDSVRVPGPRSGPGADELGWDDSLYQRDGGGRDPSPPGRGHRRGGPKSGGPKKGKRRVLRWFAITASLLILATAGAGYLYYEHLNGNLGKDDLNLGDSKLDKSAPNAAGQTPLNILLLGSDSRSSKENVRLGGARAERGRKPLADVQMLLHVSADRSNMSVISVPRDTRVTIPKCTDTDDGKVYPKTTATINASLQNGGPGCTVATWEELTGVPVDHFMMIDFSGVVDMADAVGGVPVCVDNNVYDSKSGLRLKKGESVVKGEQALQWLRTRHGFEDGSDIGRAKAQHMYMNSMVRQLKAGTKLTDPGKLQGLAEAATKALTVDRGLGTVKKLYDLGNDLKRVPTGRITMATMPWVPDPQNAAHIVPKPDDADQIFSMLRDDTALDGKDKKKGSKKSPAPSDPAAPKAEIPVTVQNGTGTATQAAVTGRAALIADRLSQLGFTQATADSTPKSRADTTVSYRSSSQRGDALAVAKALGLPAGAVRHSSSVPQITVVLGADWRSGTAYPKSNGSGGRDDNKAPESADALNGDDKSACMKVNPANIT